jgi:hypothetical protein
MLIFISHLLVNKDNELFFYDKEAKHAQILKFCIFGVKFNSIFNNISIISWLSVLLVEETIPGEKHQPVASR